MTTRWRWAPLRKIVPTAIPTRMARSGVIGKHVRLPADAVRTEIFPLHVSSVPVATPCVRRGRFALIVPSGTEIRYAGALCAIKNCYKWHQSYHQNSLHPVTKRAALFEYPDTRKPKKKPPDPAVGGFRVSKDARVIAAGVRSRLRPRHPCCRPKTVPFFEPAEGNGRPAVRRVKSSPRSRAGFSPRIRALISSPVSGFVFEQTFGDGNELTVHLGDDPLGFKIGFVDQPATDFIVDLLRGRFGNILRL